MSAADRELYQAQFCAGCHALREFGGLPASRLTNYDQAFLILAYSALEGMESAAPIQWKPCTAFTPRRVPVQPLSTRGRRVVSALTIALVQAKLRDDVEDEGSFPKRAASRLLSRRAETSLAYLRREGFPVDHLTSLAARQSAVEAASQPSLDDLSEPTSSLLADVFGWIGSSTRHAECEAALRQLGRAIGRFIYVWDAVLDEQKDARRGRFNALHATYGQSWPRHEVRRYLVHRIEEMHQAIDALPLGGRKGLVRHQANSLSAVVAQRMPVAKRKLPVRNARLHSQRGDCDCGLDGCCVDDCCCRFGSCLDCCDCHCCCDDLRCCGGREGRKRRRESR